MKVQNGKLFIILISSLFLLFMLPALFIVMLPSLIFGNSGLTTMSGEVLNDTSLIMENIADAETCIESVLREKHTNLLSAIYTEAAALGNNCEYSITDEFADQIIYESTLIISQFCASQNDYKEINLTKLKRLLRDHSDDIFSYYLQICWPRRSAASRSCKEAGT